MARPLHQSGTPALVLDILETHFGSWFDLELLHTEVCRFMPESKPPTLRKAVNRLVADGRIEYRKVHPERGRFSDYKARVQYRIPFRTYLEEAI